MAEPLERPGPDLRPWDPALAQRVQPVLSALFHDMMSPLTLLKNRLYLVQRHLREMETDPETPATVKERMATIHELLEGIEDAVNRVYRGMTVPRDAIWATILEGAPFDPADIVERVSAAMRAPEPEMAGSSNGTKERESVPGTS